MLVENDADHLVREVQVRIIRAFLEDKLLERVERIPLEMRPTGSTPTRCCVYKDRVLIKYRCMATLGFGREEETDELTPLAEYARQGLQRERVGDAILTILDPACSGCVKTHFHITDACRGCLARPCMVNCPKKAIVILDGQARIDQHLCVNCGLCQKVCPYHAIVRIPIPCEEACPVDAIQKDEAGRERIDYTKCIYCGKCADACPFGAILERSQILDVLRALRGPRPVTALPAPAMVGQFAGGLGRIVAALKRLGFRDVVEVAFGADQAACEEAAEFQKRMTRGDRFMSTSCCPAYVHAARKILPALAPFVPATLSPLQLTAARVKAADPQAVTVFIGPCLAKRKESVDDARVDCYLTFEELAAFLTAAEIDVAKCEPAELGEQAHADGRGFPLPGGVARAVQAQAGGTTVKSVCVNGLNRETLRQLASFAAGTCPGNLVEVMNCEGGCVAGPAVIAPPAQAGRRIEELQRSSAPLPPAE
jgi:[FeFe] hydrogenase (group B1/B3)